MPEDNPGMTSGGARGEAARRGLRLLIVVLLLTGVDQATKYTAKYLLEGAGTIRYLGDIIRLGYVENTGAFLGLGADLPEESRRLIFVLLVAVFLLLFSIAFIRRDYGRLLSFAAALVIGGGVSNLIDRVVNRGGVIDFMNVGVGSLRTGVFNVADMAIMAGVGMFLLGYFWRAKQGGTTEQDTGSDP